MADSQPPKYGSSVRDESATEAPVVSLRDYIDIKVDALGVKIGALAQRLEDLGRYLNARIDALDAKVDDLAQHLNARIDSLDAKVDDLARQLNARIDSLEVKVDDLGRQLNARMDRMEKRFITIWIFSMSIVGAGFLYLTSRMDRMAERMDGMAERMNEILIILERLP